MKESDSTGSVVEDAAQQPFDANVFVLTPDRTRSAAEHFTLALKRTGRATVIGDTTFGAGNSGGWTPVAPGFSAWIPLGRTFDPDTGQGWENVGIAPNVRVLPEEALIEALVRSGLDQAEAERLSLQHGPDPQRMKRMRTDRPPNSGI